MSELWAELGKMLAYIGHRWLNLRRSLGAKSSGRLLSNSRTSPCSPGATLQHTCQATCPQLSSMLCSSLCASSGLAGPTTSHIVGRAAGAACDWPGDHARPRARTAPEDGSLLVPGPRGGGGPAGARRDVPLLPRRGHWRPHRLRGLLGVHRGRPGAADLLRRPRRAASHRPHGVSEMVVAKEVAAAAAAMVMVAE